MDQCTKPNVFLVLPSWPNADVKGRHNCILQMCSEIFMFMTNATWFRLWMLFQQIVVQNCCFQKWSWCQFCSVHHPSMHVQGGCEKWPLQQSQSMLGLPRSFLKTLKAGRCINKCCAEALSEIQSMMGSPGHNGVNNFSEVTRAQGQGAVCAVACLPTRLWLQSHLISFQPGWGIHPGQEQHHLKP